MPILIRQNDADPTGSGSTTPEKTVQIWLKDRITRGKKRDLLGLTLFYSKRPFRPDTIVLWL
jgi:hypothetical protein